MLILSVGCVTREVVVERPAPVYRPAPPPAVVSVYVDPPIGQPEPIGCPWAPPPMLVEPPPPPPFEGAVWIGGYWAWQGTWVWASGRWVGPPQPGYGWHPPYYENRGGTVVFVSGFWGAAGVVFHPPAPGISITLAAVAPGAVRGPRPMGPEGVFVPPPPGSRVGIIVPAPIGTPPAVVTGAPPVVNVGMRIRENINSNNTVNSNNTTIVNNHVTNVTNVTNVIVEAPASATANGKAVSTTVPAQAHLAAAMHPVVSAPAPRPASSKAIPAFHPGSEPVALPPPQPVRATPAERGIHPAQPSERLNHPTPPAPSAREEGRPEEFHSPRPRTQEPKPLPREEDRPQKPEAKPKKKNPHETWRDQDKRSKEERD
ncbi:MAG: hypothetical protein JST05_04370 [Acidobacteria bacterium]|nr:hypothetical protein [Acidobacteriota bacterium]